MSKLIKFWVVLLAAAIVLIVIIAAGGLPVLAADVCDEGGDWSSHQNPPLVSKPGAVEYCVKAGNVEHSSCVAYLENGSFEYVSGVVNAEGACGLSHWSYRLGDPTATPVTPTATPETPTATPTDDPEVTPTPTERPHDCHIDGDGICPGEETPTALPKTGPEDDNIWSNESWLCWGDNVWCAHNGVDGSPAQDWVFLYEGSTFEFMGETYTVELVEQVDPSNTEVLGKAGDYDVVLLTCRNWTPSGVWLDRFIVFANALDG